MNDAPSQPRGAWLRAPWLLGLAILGVYAWSLGGPWLGYDDDWLVRDNELLNVRDLSVPTRVVGGFDRETRLVLGAEYLPVRDLVTWIGRAWLGLDALGFRLVNLAIYAAACMVALAWSAQLSKAEASGAVAASDSAPPTTDATTTDAPSTPTSTAPATATATTVIAPLTLAVWLFALHPIHAESVAWIAGLKDVLALLFVSLALLGHARGGTRDRALALACVFLACGSKSVAVVSPVLFVLTDLARNRPIDRALAAGATVICGAWALVHVWVGSIVGMYAAPLGEGPVERVGSIAVLFARYAALSLGAHAESVIYDVDVHALDAASLLALAGLVVSAALAGFAWRRGQRWPLFALAWFVAALLPTSQLFAPLQNRMADRYLLLAVLGPCVLAAMALDAAARRLEQRLADGVTVAALVVVGGLASARGHTFADPTSLFVEATQQTERDANAPSLLGRALMNDHLYLEAELAFRDAVARDGFRTDHSRRDGNSLGQLLAGLGRAEEARDVYATLVERYPDDPRVLHNLAVMEAQTGHAESATAHEEELARRFPDYRTGTRDRPGPL